MHPYTFRTDVNFARNFAGGGRSNASAVNAEYRQMWNLGVDVLFSDFADDAVRSRSLFAADQVEVVEYANAAMPMSQRDSFAPPLTSTYAPLQR